MKFRLCGSIQTHWEPQQFLKLEHFQGSCSFPSSVYTPLLLSPSPSSVLSIVAFGLNRTRENSIVISVSSTYATDTFLIIPLLIEGRLVTRLATFSYFNFFLIANSLNRLGQVQHSRILVTAYCPGLNKHRHYISAAVLEGLSTISTSISINFMRIRNIKTKNDMATNLSTSDVHTLRFKAQ